MQTDTEGRRYRAHGHGGPPLPCGRRRRVAPNVRTATEGRRYRADGDGGSPLTTSAAKGGHPYQARYLENRDNNLGAQTTVTPSRS